MAEKTLKDLLIHTMKDMYFAENAIYKALPKMIEGAQNADLEQGLNDHREETKMQIRRLEQMFQLIGERVQAVECKGIGGILEEGEEALEEFGEPPVGDAAVIASCQAVEHYEITRYGTMHAWASELGLDEVVELIEETLREEYAADDKLTALAEGGVNRMAEGGEGATMQGGRGAKQTRGKARSSSGRSTATRSRTSRTGTSRSSGRSGTSRSKSAGAKPGGRTATRSGASKAPAKRSATTRAGAGRAAPKRAAPKKTAAKSSRTTAKKTSRRR
jgi:ferritin-like metal-binding protein YciE